MTDVEVTEEVVVQESRNYKLTPISEDNSKFVGVIENDTVSVTYSSIEGTSTITVPISQAQNAKAFVAMLEADIIARASAPSVEPDGDDEEEPEPDPEP